MELEYKVKLEDIKNNLEDIKELTRNYDNLINKKKEIKNKIKELKSSYETGKFDRDIFATYNKHLLEMNSNTKSIRKKIKKLIINIKKILNREEQDVR